MYHLIAALLTYRTHPLPSSAILQTLQKEIQTKTVQKTDYINIDELAKIEKYVRLSQEMNINLEGLHAVGHLLALLEQKEEQILALKNELNYLKQIQ